MTMNSFVWYELLTTDVPAAESFYRRAIGWIAEPFPDSDPPYLIVRADKAGVGGIMKMPDRMREGGGKPHWLGYIRVADVDEAAGRVAQAGGAVHHEPADIPKVGRFAVVADPQGAVFYLFAPQGEAEQPAAAQNAPGHVGWNELMATDGAAAFRFYAAQFGWTASRAMDMGPMGVYQIFGAAGVDIGGMMTDPAGAQRGRWRFYFNVPALNAALERVRGAGGKALSDPMQVPGGSWVAQCEDPQGAHFALVAPQR